MKMTIETQNMSSETVKFNKAADLFFGMNPTNRFWILLALYFAKRKQLVVINNYSNDDDGLLMSSLSIELISNPTIAETWIHKSIHSRSVVAFVANEQKDTIKEILSGFDQLISGNVRNGQGTGLFGMTRMDPIYLVEVAETLINLPEEWYERNGTWAFNILANKATKNEMSMSCQPKALTSLVLNILDANDGKVYNPYAGICSYGAESLSDCTYYGQEISYNYVLGKLNLLFHDKSNAICKQENSIVEWLGYKHFDYIVATPPFKAICESSYKFIELDYLARSSRDANKKAIGVYPSYICFNARSDKSSPIIDIVENDWLESVISLPEKIFDGTNVSTVILLVNKNKDVKGRVNFIDASECFDAEGRRNSICVSDIMELVQNPECYACISIDAIKDNDFIIYPPYYTTNTHLDIPKGFVMYRMGDVLTSLSTESYSQDNGLMFSTRNLKLKGLTGIVHSSELEYKPTTSTHNKCVVEDCLVLRLWRNIGLFYLYANGETVVLPSPCYAFKLDTKIVEPLYLLNEFKKDYLVAQIERFGKVSGGRSTALRLDDFMNLKVFVPDHSKQITMALASEEESIKAIAIQQEDEYKKKLDEFVHNQRQRKHAVAQVLNEILPAIENVKDYIESNPSVSKDSVVSKRSGKTLEDYLESLQTLTSKVVAMVDNFTSSESYAPAEDINLYEFLSEYIKTKCTNDRYDISLSPAEDDIDDFFSLEDGENDVHLSLKVKASKRDLTQILDNLIANAVQHGFTDPKVHNTIWLCLAKDYTHTFPMGVLSICNDGKLVSESMDLDKLFTWGVGHHTGIGCWQAKDIAEHFGGTIAYEEKLDSPYPCVFDIYLPLIED